MVGPECGLAEGFRGMVGPNCGMAEPNRGMAEPNCEMAEGFRGIVEPFRFLEGRFRGMEGPPGGMGHPFRKDGGPIMTFLRHLLSILLLPATVTLVVPYVILSSRPFPPLNLVAMFSGALVILCGLALV